MQETSDVPPGLILLAHAEQIGITPTEMRDALPEPYRDLVRILVEIDTPEAARLALRARDFIAAQRALEEQVRTKLAPLREKHPDFRIAYFGSSPVPLALLLGFLLETWQQIDVVPHHHARRVWGWREAYGGTPARLVPPRLPDYRERTPGEAVIRVSTSHQVDAQATREIVPDALIDLDIELEHPAEDAFTSPEEMEAVAAAFRRALDVIGDSFPKVHRVHLFASVQPGMALLLGAQISKTMHPPVQTYQYARNTEDGPHHTPAVLVNGPERPAPPPLTAEDEARAASDRERLATDIERMKGLAKREQGDRRQAWTASALGRLEAPPTLSGPWRRMPLLHQTPLLRTKVDNTTRAVDDSFRLATQTWQIDDRWLAKLARRLPEEEQRRRALRMLVLHELAHRGPQMLTSTSSREIGRFAKVLEEIDYQADVWALLYEHALTALHAPSEVERPQVFFQDLVGIATQTMWAFDDDGTPLHEIQIRRLSRYLIWSWQYLLLERSAHREEPSLDAALEILAHRPTLELAGPHILSRGERLFFALSSAQVRMPELAVYHEGKLFRIGERPDFSISALLDGVRERDGVKILDVLRAAFEQTTR